MKKIKEIIRLKYEAGLSKRAIAGACKISNSTVGDYLRRAAHAGHYVYRMKGEEVAGHVKRIGAFMQQLVNELKPGYAGEAVYQVLERVFGEHFRMQASQVQAIPNAELGAACLQSPDDLEATYREKRGAGYQDYVANVSETCDPENHLQLITKVQVAPNNCDDDELLAEALPNLKERGGLDEMYTDGGYGGKRSDPLLAQNQVQLISKCHSRAQPGS